MLAYASYQSRRSSRRRNNPLRGFPCFEMSPSASNLLITVADSISTSSLLVDGQPRKLLPFPLAAGVSAIFLPPYPHTSTASTLWWHSLRNPLQAHLGYYGNSVTMQGVLPV